MEHADFGSLHVLFYLWIQPLALQFPNTFPIERILIPSWVLISLIFGFTVLAWIRVIYTRFLFMNFKSVSNYQISIQLYKDSNQVQKAISRVLLGVYFLSISLFLWLILYKKGLGFLSYTGKALMGIILIFFLSMTIFRGILMKSTGHVFDRNKLFNAALYQNQLYNKILGIVLLPIVFFYAYSKGFLQEIFMYLGFTSIAFVYALRIIRQIIFIYKNVILLFYFILYLCCLEIIPLLVIIKVIISLIPVP